MAETGRLLNELVTALRSQTALSGQMQATANMTRLLHSLQPDAVTGLLITALSRLAEQPAQEPGL
jgi:hypothetical protein